MTDRQATRKAKQAAWQKTQREKWREEKQEHVAKRKIKLRQEALWILSKGPPCL